MVLVQIFNHDSFMQPQGHFNHKDISIIRLFSSNTTISDTTIADHKYSNRFHKLFDNTPS